MMRLVADIGGTNSRFGLSRDGIVDPATIQSFVNADWNSFDAVISAYYESLSAPRLADMVIAVAGPVRGDKARLTNKDWSFSAPAIASSYGCQKVVLLNDLTALGYAVPKLQASQVELIAKGKTASSGLGQSLVVGIGTGFNVSPVTTTPHATHCTHVEAGHVSMPRSVSLALTEAGCDPSDYPTVETLFSGRGFQRFCRQMTGNADLIGTNAIKIYGSVDADAITGAVDRYSVCVGWLLRDLSLSYMPTSGIYFAGSVAQAIARTVPGTLVEIFQRLCPIRGADHPTLYTIEDGGAALAGCAGYVDR